MKKHLVLFTILIVLTIASKAQIPNSGFEDWSPYGNGMLPAGWWSANDSVNSTDTYFPVTRSADHYPDEAGNYSIRIANNTSLLPQWGGIGIAWPGGWEGNNYPSFPITGHPDSFCGYYKFQPQNNDSMRIFIALYNGGNEVVQAELVNAVIVSNWTPFIIPIPAYTTADSARLMLSSFDADVFQINGNSVLYVDNLSFDHLINSIPGNMDAAPIKLFPNPVADKLNVCIDRKNDDELTIFIYDVYGIIAKSVVLRSEQNQIDMSNLSNGIYFIAIQSKDISYNQSIIIQK